MDKDYQEPINEKDKNTLHTAGVDIANLSAPTDDKSQNSQAEETLIDIDGSTSQVNDDDIKKTGIHFVSDEPSKTNKEELGKLSPEEKSVNKIASKDLEAEFHQELSDIKTPPVDESAESVLAKTETLSELLQRIDDKLGNKKTEVKSELDDLKKMKNEITKDIDEIKNLEASEEKIKTQIDKIETIKKEVETIQEEFGNEKL